MDAPTPAHFKGGAKRHRKVLRDNIQGITKPAICRLARRGGVKRILGIIYEETTGVRKVFPLPPRAQQRDAQTQQAGPDQQHKAIHPRPHFVPQRQVQQRHNLKRTDGVQLSPRGPLPRGPRKFVEKQDGQLPSTRSQVPGCSSSTFPSPPVKLPQPPPTLEGLPNFSMGAVMTRAVME